MIRKNISIEAHQEEALKLIVQETGKSESEIFRAALDEKYPKLMKGMRRKHTQIKG